MTRAKPTAKTMKRRAPIRPMRRAARREKTTTVMVMMMKRPSGRPERATWERRKDWGGVGGISL